MDQIFTTHGHLPADLIEIRERFEEDEDKHVKHTDKYLKSTGEWVGNDIHVTLKQVPSIFGEQAQL